MCNTMPYIFYQCDRQNEGFMTDIWSGYQYDNVSTRPWGKISTSIRELINLLPWTSGDIITLITMKEFIILRYDDSSSNYILLTIEGDGGQGGQP